MKNIVVAIDGPSASGKSTISKRVAENMNMAYFDTGATYRAATWWCIRNNIDFKNEQLVADTIANIPLTISLDPKNQILYCDNVDITDIIRSEEITSQVTNISTNLKAREVLGALQRRIIDNKLIESSIIAEGRDITSVIYPDAEVKYILSADENIRAERRAKQRYGADYKDKLENVSSSISNRDQKDSNVVDFVTVKDDVHYLDTGIVNFDKAVETVQKTIDETLDNIQIEQMFRSELNDYDLDDSDYDIIDKNCDDFNASVENKPLPVLSIIGRPNVGKSTLVNRILGRREAVVQDKPGVTRDRVAYKAEWAGRKFTLIDTGGWEIDLDGVEKQVASQAELAVGMADAVVFVVDATVGSTSTDERLVQILRKSKKPVILVANKVDSNIQESDVAALWSLGLGQPYPVSALHGRGSGDLLDVIVKVLPEYSHVATNVEHSDARRIAIIGRPNVGKSSLLNKLAGEDRVVVHDMDGTTRDPVDEVIQLDGRNWILVDTAGIRRRVHKSVGADYYALIRTTQAIEKAELALVLFDASLPITEQDVRVVQQAVDAGRAIVIVNNKWDLVDEDRQKCLKREIDKDLVQMPWVKCINISAKTGWHTNRLINAIDTALDSWEKRISTSRLNAFLGELVSSHPHPLRGGKQPRILFGTQIASRPPRFVIFTTGFLDPSYRRFIERRLRETFGFEGTPLQINVRIREKKKNFKR